MGKGRHKMQPHNMNNVGTIKRHFLPKLQTHWNLGLRALINVIITLATVTIQWKNRNFRFPRFTYVCGSVKRILSSNPISAIPSLGLFSKVLYESGSLSIAVIFRDWIKGFLRFHPFLTIKKKRFTMELSLMYVQGYL